MKRICGLCKEEKDVTEFYKDRSKYGYRYICKICDKERILNIQRGYKKKWVEYMGGCCSLCGYNKYYGALDFYHTNPNMKSFNLSSKKLTKGREDLIKEELKKCILVCANCHREIHKEGNSR